ncbi:MAG: SbcC/MukB-like Walker B domain-containing protein [Clostridium sp.]
MKPIKLKIKGLNSFQEEQTIDFIKLTDRGLFGIFGPTGSGKSTVLDGITLALYGSVARKSSNFINTNCDRVNVSFEFQISGAEVKKYLVDREFKRKKDGGINSGKCRLVDITDENAKEVMADSVKAINKNIEEIIGLNIDDFTRTVVLPQGKFSEFLKLEGRERREMLERLFNLEKYGDELSIKLSSKIKEENNKNSILEGQLKGYEDISIGKLQECKEILNNKENNFLKIKEEFDNIEKIDKDNEELWSQQIELNEYKEKEKNLKEKTGLIEEYKIKIKLGESAEKVMPYIKAYENTLKLYVENKGLLDSLTKKIHDINNEKEEIEKKWNNAKKEKDEKMASLLIKEQKVKDAIEDKKLLKSIEENLKSALYKKEVYEKKLKKDNDSLIKLEKDIQEKIKYINVLEEKLENLKIDESFKEKVQNGLLFEENISKVNRTLIQEENKLKLIDKSINETIISGKSLKESLQKLEDTLKGKNEALENLSKDSPGDQNVLLEFRKLIGECSLKYETYKRLMGDIEKSRKEKETLEKSISDKNQILNKYEIELEQLKEKQKSAVMESLAVQLREGLKEGEVCPVCGSTHHIKENIKNNVEFSLSKIDEEIDKKENALKEINTDIIQEKTNISALTKSIVHNEELIKNLGNSFLEKSIEDMEKEFTMMKNSIEEYTKNKEKLEAEIRKIEIEREKQDGEIRALRATLKSYQNQKADIEKELISIRSEKDTIDNKIESLKNETGVENFREKNTEIRENEIERNNISNEINKNRKYLESLNEEKERCRHEINLLNEEIVKKNTEIESYEINKREKIKSIKSKAGSGDNLDELLSKIEAEIKLINSNYDNAEKMKAEIENIFKEYSEKLISSESNDRALSLRKENEKETMNSALASENFNSKEDAEKSLVSREELVRLKEEVESYRENISKIQGAIGSLKEKIGERSISREQYDNHKLLKNLKSEEVKKVNEEIIRLKDEVIRIGDKLKEQKGLLEEKGRLEHKLGILKDLEKLFKGKKFVEFVAAHQLKYISLEASRRLKEITHGVYGLEVDENGKFIIRDYKNGGAKRDASTLSGGETFLASLSLALALSAQIQLKGTAPLELFFLDEGFGTLDDELLEVVMSSLEQIHNDKLKVGIISHVESIKNRVPVKLIISPAESGNGGSKVKIERS